MKLSQAKKLVVGDVVSFRHGGDRIRGEITSNSSLCLRGKLENGCEFGIYYDTHEAEQALTYYTASKATSFRIGG